MKIDDATLVHVFTYHAPFGTQPERYAWIREAALAYAKVIVINCPESEERTLALREVQRSVMMANASIAINESEA